MSAETSQDGAAPAPSAWPGGRPVVWQEWQAQNADLVPSAEAFLWAYRTNRAELIERGAVTYLCGRLCVVPGVFERVFVEIGTRMLGKLARHRSGGADGCC